MVLCEPAFSWTFMIMLIPTIYIYFNSCNVGMYLFMFCFNWAVHCIVDDSKANKKMINLIQDQLIHISQVILTWAVFII